MHAAMLLAKCRQPYVQYAPLRSYQRGSVRTYPVPAGVPTVLLAVADTARGLRLY